ncbi:MAG: glycoside hydrolase family 13 domain protein [Gemmatimonadetes bacterium]|nr:glycoside hydrolase family 13 domain protein [Gemmatimonadota bacterium]
MSGIDDDPLLRRALEELRRLPATDPEAVRRVVGVAAEARVSPADEPVADRSSSGARSMRRWTAVSVAAAAAIVGFVARGVWLPGAGPVRTENVASPSVAAAAPMVKASAGGAIVALPQQFVLENSAAHRISVVGDFNKWNAASAPMTRAAEGGLWSTVIPILPGRHVYGFMIDDSLFTLDPRAPKARDPDLGTDGSVVIVGRP